jgi:flavorubredoxin
MFDVSVTDSSEILAQCFKYSHLIFASTTYNTGIFIKMDELLRDIAAHNLKNRTVGFIQNGSWAPASGKLMRELLAPLGNMNFIEEMITLKSSLKEEQNTEIDAFTESIIKTIKE